MDKTIDWGGPAFPELGNTGYNSEWQMENGMMLRDYFAGQALIGWRQSEGTTYETDAKYAYRMADAMIKARNGS